PIDVVIVHVADATASHRGEAEARLDRSVCVKAPLADVAVPARLHLADQDDLLPSHVHRDAGEIAGVRSGVENGRGRRTGEAEAGSNVHSVGLNRRFPVLPIAVRPALVVLVFDVENRNVSAIENALSAVIDETKLDAGAVGARGAGRTYGQELPQHGASLRDG